MFLKYLIIIGKLPKIICDEKRGVNIQKRVKECFSRAGDNGEKGRRIHIIMCNIHRIGARRLGRDNGLVLTVRRTLSTPF